MKWSCMWVDDWDKLWWRLWSVRLNALGVVLGIVDFCLPYFLNDHSPRWLVLIGSAINAGAWYARGIPQRGARAAVQKAKEDAAQSDA